MDNIFYLNDRIKKAGLNLVVNLILNGQYLLLFVKIEDRTDGRKGRKPYSKWTISSTNSTMQEEIYSKFSS